MKRKWFTFLLISLVILIWGLIIFRVISPEKATIVNKQSLVFNDDSRKLPKQYKLLLNYRDVFLGSKNISIIKTNKVVKPKVVQNTILPHIKFKGIISNSSTPSKSTAIIEVEGEENFLKINQAFKGVKLLKFNEAIALISYEGHKITLNKTNE